jgi:hypothetical protein
MKNVLFLLVLMSCPAIFQAQDQKNGLIAYWNFDNSPDGNISNLLTDSEAVEYAQDSIRENAVRFTQANSYLTYANGVDLYNYFSLAFWMKPTKSEALQTIFQQVNQKRHFTIQLKKQELIVLLSDEKNSRNKMNYRYAFKPDRWALVCLVMEGVYASIFIDGKMVLKVDKVLMNVRESQKQDTLMIGNDISKRNAFRGALDEIAVYNRNISAEEINRLYEKEFPNFSLPIAGEPERERDAIYKRIIEVQKKIQIRNQKIVFQFWDEGQEDGDRITLIFNDKVILSNHTLSKNKVEEKIVDAVPGKNKLILIAENVGNIPPNTAKVMVVSGDVKTKLELKSDLSQSGAVEFFLEGQ